jgi:hypothetical protein
MANKKSVPSESQLREEFEKYMKETFPNVDLEMQQDMNYYYSTAANVGWAIYKNMRLGNL